LSAKAKEVFCNDIRPIGRDKSTEGG
jgi:hypothetical protein